MTPDIPAKFTAPNIDYDYVKRAEMIPARDGLKLCTVIVIPKGAAHARHCAGAHGPTMRQLGRSAARTCLQKTAIQRTRLYNYLEIPNPIQGQCPPGLRHPSRFRHSYPDNRSDGT